MKKESTRLTGNSAGFTLLAVIAVSAFILVSCGDLAERDNPLDSGGTNYSNEGTLVIQVNDSYEAGLTGVSVVIEELDRAVLTDDQGSASIGIIPGDYTCLLQKEGFREKEVSTSIAILETKNISETLNAIPSIDSVWAITKITMDRDAYEYEYEMFVRATDYDGIDNISSIVFYEPNTTTPVSLVENGTSGYWHINREFSTDRQSFVSIIGTPMRVVIKDDNSDSSSVTHTIDDYFYYDFTRLLTIEVPQYFTLDSLHFEWKNPRFENWHHWFEPTDFRLVATGPTETVVDTNFHFDDISPTYFHYTTYDHSVGVGNSLAVQIYIYDPNGNYVRTKEESVTIAPGQ